MKLLISTRKFAEFVSGRLVDEAEKMCRTSLAEGYWVGAQEWGCLQGDLLQFAGWQGFTVKLVPTAIDNQTGTAW